MLSNFYAFKAHRPGVLLDSGEWAEFLMLDVSKTKQNLQKLKHDEENKQREQQVALEQLAKQYQQQKEKEEIQRLKQQYQKLMEEYNYWKTEPVREPFVKSDPIKDNEHKQKQIDNLFKWYLEKERQGQT